MQIESIEWLDTEEKEAILRIVNDKGSFICFSQLCPYDIGDRITVPLECLDEDEIMVCETEEYGIEKMTGAFDYKLQGRMKDVKNGVVEVCGFDLHIEEEKIPKDVTDGMYISFVTSRIDVW